MPPVVRLLRPHQYTKNLLVFAAPGAAGRLDQGSVLVTTVVAFVLFCMVSSAGYVLNDLADAEADRVHPTKHRRPIASGDVAPGAASMIGAGLGIAAVVLAFFVGPAFGVVLVAYGAITAFYTTVAKRIPWVELFVVSSGFVVRSVAGGAATDTRLSGWFIAVISFGSLLLIGGKRLGELLSIRSENHGSETPSRPVLARYSVRSLQALTTSAATGAVAAYAAWAAAEANERATDSTGSLFLRLTIVPFIVAMIRYVRLAWRGEGEAPDMLVVQDPIVVWAGVAWIALYALGIYA